MTSDAQPQPVLINWEPLVNSPRINITEKRQGVTIGSPLDDYAQSHRTVYVCKPLDLCMARPLLRVSL
jgi:hypothetical protein